MFLREAWYLPVAMARQYGSTVGLRRHQLRWLNAMLGHCRTNVPFYRDRAAYRRGPLRSLAELAELPLVTKDQLLAQRLDFVADGVSTEAGHRHLTSGTTGQRLEIVHDSASFDYDAAGRVRRYLATGRYLPTHRVTQLTILPTEKRVFERVGMFRRQRLPVLASIEQNKAALLAFRPHVLVGYPVRLRELLRALGPAELSQLRRTLRMLMSESELLC